MNCTYQLVDVVEGRWQVDVLQLISVSRLSLASWIALHDRSRWVTPRLTAAPTSRLRGLWLETSLGHVGTTTPGSNGGSIRRTTAGGARTRLRRAASRSRTIEATRRNLQTITAARRGFGGSLTSSRTTGSTLTCCARHLESSEEVCRSGVSVMTLAGLQDGRGGGGSNWRGK